MIKKIVQKYIRIIQNILITIALFFVYIVGFGITLIFVIIFDRKLLGVEKIEKDTFWKNAEGYQTDIKDCMRQS